jgi:signal transduction histidine kinase
MKKPDVNLWIEKSAEDVLAEAFHEMRNPIYNAVDYLNVLKSVELSAEEEQQYVNVALNYALYAQKIIESVYQYMNENRKDQ